MAKREFGGSEQVKERCRDERRWAALTGLWQDFTFALRQMRRSPGFAITAVLILALGIAANVIVFGVLQGLILRTLDVPQSVFICPRFATPNSRFRSRPGAPRFLALFAHIPPHSIGLMHDGTPLSKPS